MASGPGDGVGCAIEAQRRFERHSTEVCGGRFSLASNHATRFQILRSDKESPRPGILVKP